MDRELRSKIEKVADEFTSDEFLQFPRDRTGLSFQSTETNTMLILTAHLKGYTRENIKIDINEEGTKMVVTCEKPVQEPVMIETKVIKKDVTMKKFTKAFKIPVGIILDQIRTNFNEEDSKLTITMPKRVNRSPGTGIQEVKEAEFSSANSESAYQKEQVNRETEMQFPGFPSNIRKAHEEVEKHGAKDEFPGAEPRSEKIDDMFLDDKLERRNLKDQTKDDEVCEKANGSGEEEKTGDDLSSTREEEDMLPKGRSKICVPVIAGSAVILSLVVFVIHFMRKKNQSGKRKE